MTDWSRHMAEKLKKRSESQDIRDAKFLETQKMKKELGPRIWAAVKSDISAQGIALNTEMSQEIITTDKSSSSNELILVASLDSGVRRSHIRFEVESGKSTYKTEKGFSDNFELYLGSDGKMAFYSGMIPYSTGSIAKQILETFLD